MVVVEAYVKLTLLKRVLGIAWYMERYQHGEACVLTSRLSLGLLA